MKKIFLLLILIPTLAFAGCDGFFDGFVESIDNAAGSRISVNEVLYSDLENAAEINLNNAVGTITIYQEDRENIELEVEKEARRKTEKESREILDNVKIDMQNSDGKITIKVKTKNGESSDFWKWLNDKYTSSNVSIHFELKIPQQITALNITNGVGDIRAEDISCSVDMITGVGDIEIDDSKLINSNHLSSGTGGISLKADIKDANEVSLKTGVGATSLYVPEGSKYSVSAKTGVGSIKGNIIKYSKEGFVGANVSQDINGGGIPIDIVVGTGDISVKEY